MNSLTFKTNIKCTECLSKATPFLNQAVGEDNWDLNIQNPDKILTVISDDANPSEVKSAVEDAGYTAESV